MSYKVRIDSFEGPFDLLLYLVSRQKVDIGAISITEIADQYLAEVSRMETLDLDVASDFLLVASTLLEIKAQSLIPRERDELDDDLAELAPSEARDMLVERLMEYKKFKNAAAVLHNRFIAEGRMHTRPFGPDARLSRPHARFSGRGVAGRAGLPGGRGPGPARGVPAGKRAHCRQAHSRGGARARHSSSHSHGQAPAFLAACGPGARPRTWR